MRDYLSPALYHTLFKKLTLRKAYKYETLLHKGDYGENYYIILRGEVAVLL